MNDFDDFLLEDEIEFDTGTLPLLELKIFSSSNPAISIGVYNDTGDRFKYKPYFKITNGESLSKGTKIARISFEDLSYIIHHDKFKHWDLTKQDIRFLNNIIRRKGSKNDTVWDDILQGAAKILKLDSIDEFIETYNPYYMYTIPDLNDIHYASKEDWDRAKQKGIGK